MNTRTTSTPRLHAADHSPLVFHHGDLVATLDGEFVGVVGDVMTRNGGQKVLMRNAIGTIKGFNGNTLRAATEAERVAYNSQRKPRTG